MYNNTLFNENKYDVIHKYTVCINATEWLCIQVIRYKIFFSTIFLYLENLYLCIRYYCSLKNYLIMKLEVTVDSYLRQSKKKK